MKKLLNKTAYAISLLTLLLFSGCSSKQDISETSNIEESSLETISDIDISSETTSEISSSDKSISPQMEPDTQTPDNAHNAIIENIDLSDMFKSINGCAVIYGPKDNKYSLYNAELCKQAVSPYSTFKVISTLAGLKNGIIVNETSTMNYTGEHYPVSEWNENITLEKAFQTSCIWYFRQIIDSVGYDEIQNELNQLNYGNCDISEWGGSNINPLPELNGFWLGSSLKISPFEQVQVLTKIFEGESIYSDKEISILKELMFVAEDNRKIYGKTGSSIGEAWFVGFLEENDERKYFAVYLNDSSQKDNISGTVAKEIAINML